MTASRSSGIKSTRWTAGADWCTVLSFELLETFGQYSLALAVQVSHWNVPFTRFDHCFRVESADVLLLSHTDNCRGTRKA